MTEYERGYRDGESSGDASAWFMVSEALEMDEEWPDLIMEIKRLKEVVAAYEPVPKK